MENKQTKFKTKETDSISNYNLEIIGKRIAGIRKVLKLKQEDIAIELGAKTLTVNRLENGKGGSIKVLLNYLNLLSNRDVDISAIFKINFNIQEAFPTKFIKEKKDTVQGPNKVSDFGQQIFSMISVQKEKTGQSFDELLHIAKNLTNFYNQ